MATRKPYMYDPLETTVEWNGIPITGFTYDESITISRSRLYEGAGFTLNLLLSSDILSTIKVGDKGILTHNMGSRHTDLFNFKTEAYLIEIKLVAGSEVPTVTLYFEVQAT